MRSYLDILTELKQAVDKNPLIPKAYRKKIDKLLSNLFELLWPYSD